MNGSVIYNGSSEIVLLSNVFVTEKSKKIPTKRHFKIDQLICTCEIQSDYKCFVTHVWFGRR